MRILWASPLPPVRSGVSDYAVELLESLARHATIRVVVPPDWTGATAWPLGDAVELVPTDTQAAPDEISFVHVGNNPHHLWLIDRLRGPRTVVVLHDLVLHHLLVESTADGESAGDLEARLEAAHGVAGSALARARAVGFTGRRDPFLFPAWSTFVEKAAAVVVHSAWAEATLLEQLPDLTVRKIGLPVADPGQVDRMAVRARIGVEAGDTVLMHLGFLTPEKGLQAILAGTAAALHAGLSVRLVLVGEGAEGAELLRAADAVGLGDRIVATGWMQPEVFFSVPAAADLGVVLRTPSAGETSAAALRFLACGTPVAVGGRRQFLEWPEAAAPRITPGPAAPADLARLLMTASEGGAEWQNRRGVARGVYEKHHTPEAAAGQILELLSSVL